MEERRADDDDRLVGVSAIAGLVAVLAVGVATLALGLPAGIGPATVTGWAWWGAYTLYLAVFVLDAFVLASPSPWTTRALVTTQVLAGCAVVVIAPDGWSGILLVVTAASTAYTFATPLVAAIVTTQTLLVAVGVANAGWTTTEVVLATITYGSFQAFAAVVTLSRRREVDAKAELAAAHEELEHAHAQLGHAHDELAATHAELRAATALLASSTRSAERLRIARDLHDVVGHQLTALALELEVASHDRGGDSAPHVARARGIAKELLRDVRAAVGELRDAPQGLEPALRELIRDLPGLRVELEVIEQVPIEDGHALTILRSVQELVTNTLRHAEASTLRVRVVADEDGVVLHAHDDGRGARTLVPGHGLRGLRERIEGHGGQVQVDPGSNGAGFTVDARLPVP